LGLANDALQPWLTGRPEVSITLLKALRYHTKVLLLKLLMETDIKLQK